MYTQMLRTTLPRIFPRDINITDDGSGGGQKESMADINSILPAKSAFYGRYAQVTNGKTFDGNQIYWVMDDIKESGAILQASVMPYGTWYGLTESDNRNAVAIAKVCRDIYENHGVEVWLRFAHESELYISFFLSFKVYACLSMC